jgi:UPF0716 protein FxsA
MRFLAWFLLISVVELATFFWVEDRIGLGWALMLALATAVLGSYLVRRAGMKTFVQFQTALDSGRLPGRELTHGAAILVAGAFLITPGFLTDAIGFILLIPAVRDFIHARLAKRIGSRARVMGGSVIDTREVIDVEPLD